MVRLGKSGSLRWDFEEICVRKYVKWGEQVRKTFSDWSVYGSAHKMGRTGAPDLFLTVRIRFAADHGKNPADFGRCPHRTRSVRTSSAKIALKTCGLSDGSRTGPRTIGLGPCSRTLSVWSALIPTKYD